MRHPAYTALLEDNGQCINASIRDGLRHPAPTVPLEGHRRPAWQGQAAGRRQTLPLPPMLLGRQPEILPRYVAYYTQLRALPRRVRRALQRQWRQSLAGVALLLALGVLPGHAATIEVTDTCSLVDAIRAANTDTAQGGCPAGEGADTISAAGRQHADAAAACTILPMDLRGCR